MLNYDIFLILYYVILKKIFLLPVFTLIFFYKLPSALINNLPFYLSCFFNKSYKRLLFPSEIIEKFVHFPIFIFSTPTY